MMHIHNRMKPVTNKTVLPTIHYSWTVSERNRRLLLLVVAVVVLLMLLIADVRSASWLGAFRPSLAVSYILSLLIALLFFAVGAVVWLYGRQRRVAALLFGFCYIMTLTFSTLIGIDAGNNLLNAIGSSCCALSGPFLTLLLLSFPTNTF